MHVNWKMLSQNEWLKNEWIHLNTIIQIIIWFKWFPTSIIRYTRTQALDESQIKKLILVIILFKKPIEDCWLAVKYFLKSRE
jgi:hypothetical protein